jgi:hypothetical protein
MNKPSRSYPRPLAELIGRAVGDVFAKQGFASGELVTHWPEIVGDEVAAHAEPIKLQWQRTREGDEPQPATLLLRVEGPAALEVQHLAPVILERVNRFLGWRAVGRIGIRQAPLNRPVRPKPPPAPSPEQTARVAATLTAVEDEGLRAALARLGAAVKQA